MPTPPTSVALGIPAELMRRRPDVRAAEREVARYSAEIGIVTADLFPRFSINGSFSWTSSQLPDLFTGQAFGGIIGPSFNWSILNYGRLMNAVRVQEALFQEFAINYQQTVLTANKEVEDALISFLKSQERTDRLQGAVESTKRSVELATTQYREGAVDFERVYNLQKDLVRQQIDLTNSRADINLSLIAIYRALRGGWQIRLNTPPLAPMPMPLPPVEEVETPAGNDLELPAENPNLPPLPEEAPEPPALPQGLNAAPVSPNDPPVENGEAAADRNATRPTPVTSGAWRTKR